MSGEDKGCWVLLFVTLSILGGPIGFFVALGIFYGSNPQSRPKMPRLRASFPTPKITYQTPLTLSPIADKPVVEDVPPPPTKQEIMEQKRREFDEALALIDLLPLPEDEKELLKERREEKFLRDVEYLL